MTTTRHTHENDLMELVRSADPLGTEADRTPDDAEALLRAILDAPRPQRRRRTRPSRTVIVRIGAAGAAAAVAFLAVSTLTGDDRGAVTPASAAVIKHAMDALDQPPGSILHVSMSATQDNGDGTTVSWKDESWQENAAPFARRQVETNSDGATTESGSNATSDQVYDPATNTIYSDAYTSGPNTQREQHAYRLSPGPTPGTLALRVLVYRIGSDHKVKPVAGRRSSSSPPVRQRR